MPTTASIYPMPESVRRCRTTTASRPAVRVRSSSERERGLSTPRTLRQGALWRLARRPCCSARSLAAHSFRPSVRSLLVFPAALLFCCRAARAWELGWASGSTGRSALVTNQSSGSWRAPRDTAVPWQQGGFQGASPCVAVKHTDKGSSHFPWHHAVRARLIGTTTGVYVRVVVSFVPTGSSFLRPYW